MKADKINEMKIKQLNIKYVLKKKKKKYRE